MHGDGDRWDVEIVGLRAESSQVRDAVSRLVAQLSGRMAPPIPANLADAIPSVPVQSGVTHAQARRTAAALESAGALIKLRPTADSHEMIELEPEDDSFDSDQPVGPDGMFALAQRLEGLGAREATLVDLDGGVRPPARPAAPTPSDGAPAPAAVSGAGRDPARARAMAAPTEQPLQLDFERAGLSHLASGQAKPAMAGSAAGGDGRSPARAVEPATPPPGATEAPRVAEPRSAESGRTHLLGRDRFAAALWATTIGLVLGLLPAMQVARSHERDVLKPLEDRMADAVARPLAARAGTIAAVSEVQAELDRAYGQGRWRFVWTWLGVAAPLGLALAFIPRLRRPV